MSLADLSAVDRQDILRHAAENNDHIDSDYRISLLDQCAPLFNVNAMQALDAWGELVTHLRDLDALSDCEGIPTGFECRGEYEIAVENLERDVQDALNQLAPFSLGVAS